MEFLKDPRFSQYRSTTTMTKYFPINALNESDANQNPIYEFLKTNEPTLQEQHQIFVEKEKTKEKLRKSTIQLTDNKFFMKKNSQRLSTIDSFFEAKRLTDVKFKDKNCEKGIIQGLKKKVIKLNQLTFGVQKFQKSFKSEKKRVNLLKNYKSMVEHHFEKFQINEDRTRKEILDHQQIIKLLLAKKSDNDIIAISNVMQSKKSSDGTKNRSKSYTEMRKKQLSKNSSHVFLDMRVDQYQNHCEQKVSQAIEQLRKSDQLKNKGFKEKCKHKISVKNVSFSSFRNHKQKESRFFRELKGKSPSDKENLQTRKTNQSQNDSILAKKNINKYKNNFVQTQISQFSQKNTETNWAFKQKETNQNHIVKNSFHHPKRHFQKRVMTAGSLDTRESLYEPGRISMFV